MTRLAALQTYSSPDAYLSQESVETAESIRRLTSFGWEMGVPTSWTESESSLRRSEAEERFDKLAREWRKECAHLSSVREMVLHPAYQQIIGMGDDAIPFLLRELERRPDHWFWALWAITQANPVVPEHRGRVREMAQDWLEWARQRRITW